MFCEVMQITFCPLNWAQFPYVAGEFIKEVIAVGLTERFY